MSTQQRVYRFGVDEHGTDVTEGASSMNYTLGGKGANLAEMARIGLPVPPGFTITCQTCVEYSGANNTWPDGALEEIVSSHVSAESHPELVVDGEVCFPSDPSLQLRLAIQAVFGSWMNERAILYRKQHAISDDLGTAVNVQVMVFGNKGETSATGVAFTRNPADGTKEFYGDFLVNAQGEDVVAGIRNTEPITDLKKTPGLEEAGAELEQVFVTLENHYRDMCDIEFTIEQGKLWMLQTRVGKRTATAALRIAIEMVEEGLITRDEAVSRIDPSQLDQLLHPQFDTTAKVDILARGLNATPAPPWARSSSLPMMPSRAQRRASRASSFAGKPIPMTSRAWLPQRASSRATVARPAMLPSSRAAWVLRASAVLSPSASMPPKRRFA